MIRECTVCKVAVTKIINVKDPAETESTLICGPCGETIRINERISKK